MFVSIMCIEVKCYRHKIRLLIKYYNKIYFLTFTKIHMFVFMLCIEIKGYQHKIQLIINIIIKFIFLPLLK